MGLRFRKSVKLGPFRINFSKSGVGYSYGVKGYRVTHKADGGVRTTASIPGTGISYVEEKSAKKVAAEKAANFAPKKEVSPMPESNYHKVQLSACPKCGKPAVVGAAKCYHCGYILDKNLAAASAKKSGGGKGKIIAGVLAGVVALGGAGIMLGGGDEAAPAPTPAPVPEIVTPSPEPSTPAPYDPVKDPYVAPEVSAPAPAPDVATPAPAPESDPEPAPEPQPVPEPAPEPEPAPAPVETPAPTVEQTPEAEQTTPVTVSYIGNKNSKVFHETWCDSVDRMKDTNKVELSSRDEAISLGFDGCERCTP